MKESLQYILNRTASSIPHTWLMRISGVRNILPFYHTVSDDDLPHLKHLYPVLSKKTFEQQLDYLLKYYKPASYKQLLNDKQPDGNHFILSFDDGLRQFYDVAAPILLRKGIPAVCFVNTGFIDNKSMFFRMKTSLLIEHLVKHSDKILHNEVRSRCTKQGINYQHPSDLKNIKDPEQLLLDELGTVVGIDFNNYLKEYQPYMTGSQLLQLRAQGFDIGSHSVTHPYYPLLTLEQQVHETLTSVSEIKSRFNMEDGLFSFPYTDFEIRKSFFEAIKNKVKLTFGTANIKTDCIPTNFQRIPMELFQSDDPDLLIKLQYVLHILKKWSGKSKIERS